ncbi:hypothetical protein [Phyllobacterium bourgognense]|uniref:1,4-alpha-glucan branching enzyme n=1 Tax=Phyllobacterium bourgognense TaxID=314236 RepID=A0A368YMU2_9HYPH|nr:hypothetical protein [Phyllobacterium bourgognense]RCW81505.1 hypothetical protein C7476_11059 [Phyllobacterium bourgognense]
MAETRLLTDHQEIRDWAAARSGIPAIRDPEELIGSDEPVLSIQFGQHAYEDDDRQGADRPEDLGGPRLVEWDEWFTLFDQSGLGLVVAEDTPGQRDEFHEIVRR